MKGNPRIILQTISNFAKSTYVGNAIGSNVNIQLFNKLKKILKLDYEYIEALFSMDSKENVLSNKHKGKSIFLARSCVR